MAHASAVAAKHCVVVLLLVAAVVIGANEGQLVSKVLCFQYLCCCICSGPHIVLLYCSLFFSGGLFAADSPNTAHVCTCLLVWMIPWANRVLRHTRAFHSTRYKHAVHGQLLPVFLMLSTLAGNVMEKYKGTFLACPSPTCSR